MVALLVDSLLLLYINSTSTHTLIYAPYYTPKINGFTFGVGRAELSDRLILESIDMSS